MPENEQAGWSGGFDVVLGNPPWEHTELKEQEWFAARDPEIAHAEGVARKRMISALVSKDAILYNAFLEARRQEDCWSHFVRNSGRYPLCGRGRINTYAIFAETNRMILSRTGRVGCIVQSGIATDDNAKSFFQDVVKSRALVSIYDFDNVAGIFPDVDSRYKFCLLTLTGSKRTMVNSTEFVFFAHTTEDVKQEERRFTLSLSDIALINTNTLTCPIFRSKHDAELNKAIYQRFTVLVRERPSEINPWGITFRQGIFNMASDSHLFRTREKLEIDGWALKGNVFHREGEKYLPLYEGKMISHYDHRFGSYESLSSVDNELSEPQHNDPSILSIPRYWIHESHMPKFIGDGRKAFLAFRDITNTTNIRTAIFSILPVVPCGHTLPIVVLDTKYNREVAYLSSCTSSFIFDYLTRQKLNGTHMTFFILKQLPVLPPKQYAAICNWDGRSSLGEWIVLRALQLTYPPWNLEPFPKNSAYHGPQFRCNE